MSSDHMILSKDFTEKRIDGKRPLLVSEKFDGVPGIFTLHNGKVYCVSRQGTTFTSVQHICDAMLPYMKPDINVVGELYISGKPFKYISGKVRKDAPCPELGLRIFDCDMPGNLGYHARMYSLVKQMNMLHKDKTNDIQFVKQRVCYTVDEIMAYWKGLEIKNPLAEGIMIRYADGPESTYKLGRSWGMMRYVPKPTHDLLVVGVEEATAKKDQPGFAKGDGLGMVGRIICKWHDETTGVGPGKATHKERREWFNNPSLIVGKIIEVKCKRDPSYDKPRQPTYQHIRHDKDIPDA